MSGDILDLIDGTLLDFETSGDAMRWVPEGEREAEAELPRAAWADFTHAAVRQCPCRACRGDSAAGGESAFTSRGTVTWTAWTIVPSGDETGDADTSALQAAVSAGELPRLAGTYFLLAADRHHFDKLARGGKLAVDGRAYQRRLAARRKRKRR